MTAFSRMKGVHVVSLAPNWSGELVPHWGPNTGLYYWQMWTFWQKQHLNQPWWAGTHAFGLPPPSWHSGFLFMCLLCQDWGSQAADVQWWLFHLLLCYFLWRTCSLIDNMPCLFPAHTGFSTAFSHSHRLVPDLYVFNLIVYTLCRIYSLLKPLLFSQKMDDQVDYLNHCLLGEIPSPLLYRVTLRGLLSGTIHFWPALTYWVDKSVKQAWPFSSSIS